MAKQMYIPAFLFLLLIFQGCEEEKIIPKKGYIPNSPKETTTLNAGYFWIAQNEINSPYWKEADYVKVNLTNQSTGKLYKEGYLNMTGTFNGKMDFNNGKNDSLIIKAGYDDENIYILVEWNDESTNASFMTWLWNGPADPLKPDSNEGWTAQKNSDKLFIGFQLPNDKKDIWKWDLAATAPFSAAENMTMKNDGSFITDRISPIIPNNDGSLNNGPLYEWNGERQEITSQTGTTLLDPAHYLLDLNKTPFIGDVEVGESIFNGKADCRFCHGLNGNGIPDGYTEGGKLQKASVNRYSRTGLKNYISSSRHEGSGSQYFGKIKNNPTEVENLISFLRCISGLPGTILNSENYITDITAKSNTTIGRIDEENKRYQVLFIRKLKASYEGDITFDTNNAYTISIGCSDNDDINYIGDNNITLTFNSSKL